MSPLHPGDPGDGHGDDSDEDLADEFDDRVPYRPPLPPEDRIWRHPSEVAAARGPVETPSRLSGHGSAAGLALVSALAGAVLALGVAAAFGAFDTRTRLVERQVAVQPVTGGESDASTVAAIATRTAPAVVALRIERDGTTVPGTALVYRSDGHLLTSGHLVAGGSTIVAHTHDGWAGPATVVGIDPVTDVAVLHVDATDLDPAALGTAEPVGVGDQAVAMGAAADGGWAPAVVTGVVSALDRRVQTDDDQVLHDLIVVDVPLPAGSAGGAVLDIHGAVIAMTGPPSPGPGLAAATPIDVVDRVARQLIEHGRVRHVWLGIEGSDLTSIGAVRMEVTGGAVVNRVVDGSPAASAGLQEGDVVIAVGDEKVRSMSELVAALRVRLPGDVVVLTIRRDQGSLAVRVTLGERTT